MRSISNTRLAIGIPCNWNYVPLSFFTSFTLMDKPSYQFITADNGGIETLRNDIVQKAQSLDVNRLIMLDVDQVYGTDTITKLLRHKHPVVGGLVHRRYPPFDEIMLKANSNGQYNPIEDYEPGSLVSVDATGTGCIMYDMKIFDELEYPYFKFRKNPDNGLIIGEDVGLCQDLKALGYDIYVDTSVKIGHLSTMIVNDATHRLYKEMKCKQETKNAALGVLKK
jgi:hypothetical protein